MTISFPYALFAGDDAFALHLQYGFHDEELYIHTHADFSELVIVLDGTAQHIVNGETYPIAKGDVFVISNETAHGFASAEKLRICNLMFQNAIFAHCNDIRQLAGFRALFVLEPHYARETRFVSQLRLHADAYAETVEQIAEMMEIYRAREAGWRDALYAEFIRLCLRLSHAYGEDAADMAPEVMKLADAAAYIEHHFTEPITLAQLAEKAGYSERQLFRLFRSTFGKSPQSYITSLRMQKAQTLLRNSAMPVGEVAWRCGYDDQNYFARCFRQFAGMTPTAYRGMLNPPSAAQNSPKASPS